MSQSSSAATAAYDFGDDSITVMPNPTQPAGGNNNDLLYIVLLVATVGLIAIFLNK